VAVSLTVHLPDELADRLTAAASARQVSPEQVALEAIEAALPARRGLSFSGIGRSGDGRGGAQADELIAEHFADKTARNI
jgi:predicted transcriptional regulator